MPRRRPRQRSQRRHPCPRSLPVDLGTACFLDMNYTVIFVAPTCFSELVYAAIVKPSLWLPGRKQHQTFLPRMPAPLLILEPGERWKASAKASSPRRTHVLRVLWVGRSCESTPLLKSLKPAQLQTKASETLTAHWGLHVFACPQRQDICIEQIL